MQNLSGNSLDKLNKVVMLFTRSLTKLSLHFSDFSVILYAIYKIRQYMQHY
jgi:hypothetical protein